MAKEERIEKNMNRSGRGLIWVLWGIFLERLKIITKTSAMIVCQWTGTWAQEVPSTRREREPFDRNVRRLFSATRAESAGQGSDQVECNPHQHKLIPAPRSALNCREQYRNSDQHFNCSGTQSLLCVIICIPVCYLTMCKEEILFACDVRAHNAVYTGTLHKPLSMEHQRSISKKSIVLGSHVRILLYSSVSECPDYVLIFRTLI
jgi:hypothetical protein